MIKNNFDGKTNRILITGVAGFIGFHLAKKILSTGCGVVGLDNLNDYYDVRLKTARLDLLGTNPLFDFVHGDIADGYTVSKIFAEIKPEYVVNLAAQAGVRYSIDHPQTYIDSNIVGFFNVLEACRRYPLKHLLYASSSSVYGNQQKTPFAVGDNVDKPISLYAATKKTDELMAYTYSHLYAVPATGLRFFTVYGPWGRPDMAYFKFAERIIHDESISIYNNGDMLRDFTYIDDIVDAIYKILPCPPTGENDVAYKIYNIGNNRPVKLLDFIETLEKKLGKKAKKEFLPMQPGDVYKTYADISDLQRDFGFKPTTDIDEGLEKFVQWYMTWNGSRISEGEGVK